VILPGWVKIQVVDSQQVPAIKKPPFFSSIFTEKTGRPLNTILLVSPSVSDMYFSIRVKYFRRKTMPDDLFFNLKPQFLKICERWLI
jgi:hypothetical protein